MSETDIIRRQMQAIKAQCEALLATVESVLECIPAPTPEPEPEPPSDERAMPRTMG